MLQEGVTSSSSMEVFALRSLLTFFYLELWHQVKSLGDWHIHFSSCHAWKGLSIHQSSVRYMVRISITNICLRNWSYPIIVRILIFLSSAQPKLKHRLQLWLSFTVKHLVQLAMLGFFLGFFFAGILWRGLEISCTRPPSSSHVKILNNGQKA